MADYHNVAFQWLLAD